MEDTLLFLKSKEYAADILKNQLSKDLTFHNFEYAKRLADNIRAISTEEKVDADEVEIALIAGWFSYTGFRDTYDGYQEKSKQIAQKFLEIENVSSEKIAKILSCINLLNPDSEPTNKVEELFIDSIQSDVKVDDIKVYLNQINQELLAFKKLEQSDLEGLQKFIEKILKYQYFTTYGKEVLAPLRDKLRAKLEKRQNKLQKQVDESLTSNLGITAAQLKAMKKKLQKAEGRPERGIETMFRLTSKNHIDLSGMADSKANIMISVNSIIISIILGSLMQKLDSNQHLIFPTIVVLIVNLGSMVFSILSLRPNVSDGLFTREDIESQKTNLLFFGNFHKMKRADYHWGMNKLMENANFLYSNLIDDIYFLGVVLAKKYRYLRVSYNIFMYGVVIAVITFIISIFFAEEPLPDTIIRSLGD